MNLVYIPRVSARAPSISEKLFFGGGGDTLKKIYILLKKEHWMLGAGAMGRPRGMVWGGRTEEGSGWGTHVYLWQIHVDIWQN